MRPLQHHAKFVAAVFTFVVPAYASAQSAYLFGSTDGGAPACTTVLRLTTNSTSFNVAAEARGWYQSDGANNLRLANGNYFVGFDANFPPPRRNWFEFLLPTFQNGDILNSASLLLQNPGAGGCASTPGLQSVNAVDTYSIFDVVTTLSILGTGGQGVSAAIYNDLGAGTLFGSRTVSGADNGTTVTVNLNNGALNAILIQQGDHIGFGGVLNAPSTVVPEPSTVALMASGLLAMGVGVRRKRRV